MYGAVALTNSASVTYQGTTSSSQVNTTVEQMLMMNGNDLLSTAHPATSDSIFFDWSGFHRDLPGQYRSR